MVFYSFILRKISNKIFGDIKIGEGEDPYYEEVTFVKKSFWTGSSQVVHKKLKKAIPDYVPLNDRTVLQRVRKRAYRLDMMFKIFGMRVGWLGIIGLLPVVGDLICLYLSWTVFHEAQKIQGGLPVPLQAVLLGNICIDFLLGLIPIVGDIVGIAYKANSRNTLALEQYLRKKYGGETVAASPVELGSVSPGRDTDLVKGLKQT